MKISQQEQIAIQEVLAYGESFGYGNLISHLQTAWAKRLMGYPYKLNERAARAAAGGKGYPFQMQADLVERGEWDESGKRYQAAPPKSPNVRKARRRRSGGARRTAACSHRRTGSTATHNRALSPMTRGRNDMTPIETLVIGQANDNKLSVTLRGEAAEIMKVLLNGLPYDAIVQLNDAIQRELSVRTAQHDAGQ